MFHVKAFFREIMTYFTSWEEFAKAAEMLYVNDPVKVSLAFGDTVAYELELELRNSLTNKTKIERSLISSYTVHSLLEPRL